MSHSRHMGQKPRESGGSRQGYWDRGVAGKRKKTGKCASEDTLWKSCLSCCPLVERRTQSCLVPSVWQLVHRSLTILYLPGSRVSLQDGIGHVVSILVGTEERGGHPTESVCVSILTDVHQPNFVLYDGTHTSAEVVVHIHGPDQNQDKYPRLCFGLDFMLFGCGNACAHSVSVSFVCGRAFRLDTSWLPHGPIRQALRRTRRKIPASHCMVF